MGDQSISRWYEGLPGGLLCCTLAVTRVLLAPVNRCYLGELGRWFDWVCSRQQGCKTEGM
jgi:hypothetical protein